MRQSPVVYGRHGMAGSQYANLQLNRRVLYINHEPKMLSQSLLLRIGSTLILTSAYIGEGLLPKYLYRIEMEGLSSVVSGISASAFSNCGHQVSKAFSNLVGSRPSSPDAPLIDFITSKVESLVATAA